MTEPLTILYDDPHVLAVDKPAELLTQGTVSGQPTLEDMVRRHVGPSSFLGTVHRLDRPVSGVVLWARTPKAARRLSEQFATRKVVKEYWAVVEAGRADEWPREGAWDDWLARSADASGVVRSAPPSSAGARRAVTRFRQGEGGRVPEGTLWLTLRPESGRTHQLRAQASLRGSPVWGDAAYGSTRPFRQGVALHARSLTFEHPVSKRDVTVSAELPRVWVAEGIELPVS